MSGPLAAPRRSLRERIRADHPGATLESLAGDASTRRFFRLHRPGAPTLVVMDHGEAFEAPGDDAALTAVFEAADLPVPTIVESHPDRGYLLLEDLGDRLLETALGPTADADRRRGWLHAAVDLAADVGRRGTPALRRSGRATGPRLDAARFRFEMEFFVEHGALHALDAAGRQALLSLADLAAEGPAVLCHRDFHSRNLMIRSDDTLAMVDIQDARWGPDTYDLASLLWDAYVEIDDAWRPPCVRRFLDRVGEADRDGFSTRLTVVAVQRLIKALGTFGYQTRSLGRERYRSAIPRATRRLARLLESSPPAIAAVGPALRAAGVLPRDD